LEPGQRPALIYTLAPRPVAERRMAALDGIRGIAIIAVFLSHASYDSHSGQLFSWFSWGWMGVDLFFVLSGFLITGILLDAIGQPARYYYGHFYARRFLRLAPALCLFLVALFYIAPVLNLVTRAEAIELRERQGWYWSYLVNALVAKYHGFNGTPVGTAPLWSLSVEEQFYLIWPFLIARARTPQRVRFLSVAAIVFTIGARALSWHLGYGAAATYVLTITRADSLAWGAWLVSLIRMPRGEEMVRRLRLPLVVFGGMLLGFVALVERNPDFPAWEGIEMQIIGFPALAMVCAGIVAHAVTRSSAILTWRPLARVGFYSYAFYLWHSPVLVILERTTQVHGWLFVPFGAIVCAVLTALSWIFVERTALRLKHRFPMSSTATATR
jgi:peptidoglycan/LPS O-acetylase OafA/YrhL